MTYPKAAFRCVAKRIDGQWMAQCLDLSIEASGQDFASVQGVLGHRIDESIRGTLSSGDREQAMALTKGRSTTKDALKFSWLRFISGIPFAGRNSESFMAVVSLDPRLFVPTDAIASPASGREAAAA